MNTSGSSKPSSYTKVTSSGNFYKPIPAKSTSKSWSKKHAAGVGMLLAAAKLRGRPRYHMYNG